MCARLTALTQTAGMTTLLLLVVYCCMLLQETTAEGFFQLRNRQDVLRYRTPRALNHNIITSKVKAQEVLKRYGYLQCGRRRRGERHRGGVNRGGSSTDDGNRQQPTCTPQELRRAIRLYQRNYNMPATGLLDTATLLVMSESRCGNPDIETGDSFHGPRSRTHGRRRPHRRGKRDTSRAREGFQDSKAAAAESPAAVGEPPPTEATLSRRRRWLSDYIRKLESNQLDRRSALLHASIQRRRRSKRSPRDGRERQAFLKDVVTWRLVGSAYSKQLTENTQRSALALAFRMWSEVIPLVFEEDLRSPVHDVDIRIAFGRGDHMNCQNNFDGYGGQLSHVIKMTKNAEIHVDDDEQLTVGSEQGTNLVKVAVHEVGHALGLYHTPRNYSIMYAIYSRTTPNSNFELGWEDRKMAQEIYGTCEGQFDTVFDWVRQRPDGSYIYNTYFFRGYHYWMYENRFNRTRYGDPLPIQPEWNGIPTHIDAFVHVWTHVDDATYFFKGRHYYLYNNSNDQSVPGYPRNITDDFRAIPGTGFPNIPGYLDSVFFDKRDRNLYFFRGSLVYAYDTSRGHEGCCLPGYPRMITQEFPAVNHHSSLPSDLDAVYYSYTDQSMYFFKGSSYWQNIAFNPLDRRRTNKIVGPRGISTKWYDICDVEL